MKFNKTFSGDKVPKTTKWVYSLSGIGRDACYTLVSLFYLAYTQFSGVLSPDPGTYAAQFGVITIIIVLSRIWDGVNDPMIGSIIENVHLKWGKYKPWIFLGALGTSLSLLVMFLVRPHGWWYVALFGVFYLLWEITFTFNDIAYWSMLPSLSSDEKQRNEIMTMVTVFAAVGAFAVGGAVPSLVSGNAAYMYGVIAVVVAVVFFLSQLLLVLICKEKERTPRELAPKEKSGLLEMFRLLGKNKQLLWVAVIILTYYLGSGLINTFGLSYFYFNVGYDSGGSLMFLFTVVYAAGTLISQSLYPLMAKKWTRNQLATTSFFVMAAGYILFFFVGKIGPYDFIPMNIYFLAPVGILIFSGQGIFYMTTLVMITNTIEYNEWKFGERKESIVFSVRPLAAKLGSSMEQGIYYLFLFASGLYTLSSQISALERDRGLELITEQEVITGANALIDGFNNPWGLTIYKSGIVLVPLILFAVSFYFIKRKYSIDEKFYQQMVKEIEERKVQKA